MANDDGIPLEVLLSTGEDDDDPSVKELQKKKRPSNVIKQGAAGFTDIFTGLPAVAGFAGAGLETLAKYPFNDKGIVDTFGEALSTGLDKTLVDAGATARGWVNKTLGIDEAASTEDQVARLIGSFLLPVPAGFLGGAAAKGATGFAGKATTFLAPTVRMGPKGNRLNKTFAKRAATQLGVGAAIDQGIRAGMDIPGLPLMFSEEALTGKETLPEYRSPPPKLPEGYDNWQEYYERNLGPGEELLAGGGAGEDVLAEGIPVDDLMDDGVPINVLMGSPVDEDDGIPIELLDPRLAGKAPTYRPEEAAMDKLVEEADDHTIRNLSIITAAAASLFGVHKWHQMRQAARAIPSGTGTEPKLQVGKIAEAKNIVKAQPTVGAKWEATKAIGRNVRGAAHAIVMDRTGHIVRALRNVGASEKTVDQLSGQTIYDTPGQLSELIMSGELPNGVKVTPLRDLKREFDTWDASKKRSFIDYTDALHADSDRGRATLLDFLEQVDFNKQGPRGRKAIRAARNAIRTGDLDAIDNVLTTQRYAQIINDVRGTTERVKPSLFSRQTGIKVSDADVRARLQAGRLDPDFDRIVKGLSEMSDAILESAVERGVQSRAWVDAIKRQFTRDGELAYLPGREALQSMSWFKTMAVNLGFFTSEGRLLNRVGNLYKRSMKDKEGIGAFTDPFNAQAMYLSAMMEHTNKSVAQMNILSRLTGLQIDDTGKVVLDKLGNPVVDLPSINRNLIGAMEPPVYLGKASPTDPLNQYGRLNMAFHQPDSPVAGKLIANLRKNLGPDDPGVAQYLPEDLDRLKDALVVQWGGDFYVFGGFQKGLKTALEFDPALHNTFLKMMNMSKKIFTQFTTGKLSLFGPISALYNMEMGALNAALLSKGGFKNAAKAHHQVWKDGMLGAYELFSTHVADDFAQILTHGIATKTGLAAKHPELAKKMQAVLARKAARTMRGPIQRQTGKFFSDVNASEFSGDINNILDKSVFHISERWGGNALPQFARIWSHLNASLHEGTAYGITLRRLGGDPTNKTANQIRMARRFTSDVVGDHRLRGSHADVFNALVPFSGAMLQAWSTMGRAMGKAGKMKTLAVLTTAVGLPTALEVMYNTLLDPEAKFYDEDGKEWTYGSYYWKGFTADQRNNNRIVMVPGRDPWDAILVPFVPEISLFRGLTIDAMETIFGLSEHTILEGNHWAAAGARMFNIPLPPTVKAALSAMGIDVRTGPVVETDEEGNTSLSLVQQRKLPTGERVTPNLGRARFVGSEVETRFAAILQDIFGAGGTAGVNVFEGFNSGNEQTPVGEKVVAGLDELGRNLTRQARYLQPLLGKAVRSTPDPTVARQVFAKKEAINRAQKEVNIAASDGLKSGGIPAQGATFNPTQDPIMLAFAANTKFYKQMTAPYEKEISNLRNRINTLGTALYDNYEKRKLTIKQRDELIDALNLQIDANNSIILSKYKDWEVDFAATMGDRLDRDLTGFTFDGYSRRPNPSSTSQGLPSLPQTAQ